MVLKELIILRNIRNGLKINIDTSRVKLLWEEGLVCEVTVGGRQLGFALDESGKKFEQNVLGKWPVGRKLEVQSDLF